MNKEIQIWHNRRCSKSRGACDWLENNTKNVEVIDYMNEPIKASDLKAVLKKLNMSAYDLIRKKEKDFVENWKGSEKSEAEWIKIMIANPKLIERPIVVVGDKAVIARQLWKEWKK